MKLSKKQLNRLILETTKDIRKRARAERARRPVGSKIFRESARKALALISEAATFTGQSNFKDFDDATIDALFEEIKSLDPAASIFKAMEFTPKDAEGKDLPTVAPDVNKIAQWLESQGEDVVRERIKMVGDKIPGRGLPKS